jgi:hypothetical protein
MRKKTITKNAKKASDDAFKVIAIKEGKNKDELNKTNRVLIDTYV